MFKIASRTLLGIAVGYAVYLPILLIAEYEAGLPDLLYHSSVVSVAQLSLSVIGPVFLNQA
jgi:hypothetical protein